MTWHHDRRGASVPPGTYWTEGAGARPLHEEEPVYAPEKPWSEKGTIALFLVVGLMVTACCLGGLAIVYFGGRAC